MNTGENNVQETEIHNRIAEYNCNVSRMYPLLKDRFVPREREVVIYKIVLKPILFYGSEIWLLTSRIASALQAMFKLETS